MLNGIDPIIIFQYKKLVVVETTDTTTKIPVVSKKKTYVNAPPIPLYLSERLTGIFIDSESKNLDIETKTDTLSNGDSPVFSQKGIGSVITVQMVASKESVGLSLLSAMSDLILSKVTSGEYSITYLHGAITIFNGLLHSLQISQSADTDKFDITIELSRGSEPKAPAVDVPADSGTAGLNGGGAVESVSLPASSSGASAGTTVTTRQAGASIGPTP